MRCINPNRPICLCVAPSRCTNIHQSLSASLTRTPGTSCAPAYAISEILFFVSLAQIASELRNPRSYGIYVIIYVREKCSPASEYMLSGIIRGTGICCSQPYLLLVAFRSQRILYAVHLKMFNAIHSSRFSSSYGRDRRRAMKVLRSTGALPTRMRQRKCMIDPYQIHLSQVNLRLPGVCLLVYQEDYHPVTVYGPSVLLVTRSSAIVTDMAILVLTWIKTFQHWRQLRQAHINISVASILVRDGKGAAFFTNPHY